MLEFGMLCVAQAHQRRGLAADLLDRVVVPAARSAGATTLQCELLVPRDPGANPHGFKEMMLTRFYPGLGFGVDRRVPFEQAYPEVVAVNHLLCDCDAVVFQRPVDHTETPR